MKLRTVSVALVAGLALWFATPAGASFCSADDTPAATLLLPYFEVDLGDPSGLTTLFSINNALPTASLAHVTLWTDWAVPTLNFDVYLTGYDVQTLNLRDVFNGSLPVTGSLGQDPGDEISPRGPLSEDADFPSCGAALPYAASGALPETLRNELRLAHSGGNAQRIFGGCLAENHGDGHVRGYVTVDAVKRCSLDDPTTAGYFQDVASLENRLWGTVTYLDPANNSAQQESLVHIEACDPADLSQSCPTPSGAYTFYGRYVDFDGSDHREALPTTFVTGYLSGGTFDGGTRLLVWRDTKRAIAGVDGGAACPLHLKPTWYPLRERDVVSFDEAENPQDHCFLGDVVIPLPNQRGCFPLASQAVPVGQASPVGDSVIPLEPFGWLHLDLNHTLASGEPQAGRAQAWVIVVSSARGRFSTASDAIHLDPACNAPAPPVLIP